MKDYRYTIPHPFRRAFRRAHNIGDIIYLIDMEAAVVDFSPVVLCIKKKKQTKKKKGKTDARS